MQTQRNKALSHLLDNYKNKLSNAVDMRCSGTLVRIVGLTIEAVGCQAPMGASCLIQNADGHFLEAEVVGFSGKKLFLMSTDNTHGLLPGASVIPLTKINAVQVGHSLLGRVIDGQGLPLDNKGIIKTTTLYPLMGKVINPLSRERITQPLDVGVRSINALYTIGRGQRMGLFAGSGVGKSVLMGMMTCFTKADIIVVGLIGERGREVKEFIEYNLGRHGLNRSVVVAAPANTSPLMRLHGAMRATAIAEYFRDQGAHVLLLLDSLTRFAQAQRELGLAIGEPSVSRGYPPSVFAKLSQLVERSGNGDVGQGSITGFYTVLTEGDDQQDPVADSARSFLDGHIVLSRELAESGYYPAIDIEASISRVMQSITDNKQQHNAQLFKRYYSKYRQNRDIINVGAYSKGADAELDKALLMLPKLYSFMTQDRLSNVDYEQSLLQLDQLF